MIKETIDEYKNKKEYLKQLKLKRDQFEEKFNLKVNEMSKKVTSKIISKKMINGDQELSSAFVSLKDIYGSEYATDATSQDE